MLTYIMRVIDQGRKELTQFKMQRSQVSMRLITLTKLRAKMCTLLRVKIYHTYPKQF